MRRRVSLDRRRLQIEAEKFGDRFARTCAFSNWIPLIVERDRGFLYQR
jgi:hypothetical protein